MQPDSGKLTWDRLELEDPARRARLMQMLCCGALGLAPNSLLQAGMLAVAAKKLETGRSIYRLRGTVWVNGQRANQNTRILAGDTVRTGKRSRLVFAVGGDSFLLRSDSEMELSGVEFFISNLRLLTGRLLSVFAKRNNGQTLGMSASTATIGIRGSGVYMEVEPDLTYLCTCYGQVALSASDNPDDSELITSNNHDEPRFISREEKNGTRIRTAPVFNHTNEELELLEAIVGRETPAGFGKESYER